MLAMLHSRQETHLTAAFVHINLKLIGLAA